MSVKAVSRVVFVAGILAMVAGAVSYAQGPRGFVGIQLDPSPLPELLAKHLRLNANQGIRILNVSEGGPADKVGIDRDDIIILFQGKEVGNTDEFVAAVKELPVHSRIAMEVIHLGQHKTVEFELAPLEREPKWKYPIEAQFELSWAPGRVFRLAPNGDNWVEISFENIPNMGDLPTMKPFFSERHVYHHVTDGENYTISVQGNPKDANAQIVVQSGQTECRATVGTIESLPEKYRAAARESVENARKSASQRLRLGGELSLPEPPSPDAYLKYFNGMAIPGLDPNDPAAKRDRVIERLQGQINQLQKKLEEMEGQMDKTPGQPGRPNPAPTSPAEPAGGAGSSSRHVEKAKTTNADAV